MACLTREVDSKENLEDVLRVDERVFVLFYASWCPFCRVFLSTFERQPLRNGADKRLRVNMSDLANPLWGTYDINVVPTVIFFKDERIEGRLDGTLGMGLSADQLEEFLESATKS